LSGYATFVDHIIVIDDVNNFLSSCIEEILLIFTLIYLSKQQTLKGGISTVTFRLYGKSTTGRRVIITRSPRKVGERQKFLLL